MQKAALSWLGRELGRIPYEKARVQKVTVQRFSLKKEHTTDAPKLHLINSLGSSFDFYHCSPQYIAISPSRDSLD